MLEYNKDYATLVLNCILKNSKKVILVLEIDWRDRNYSIKKE